MLNTLSVLLSLLDRWQNRKRLHCEIAKSATPCCVIFQDHRDLSCAPFSPIKSYDQLIKLRLTNPSSKPISYFELEVLDDSSKRPLDFLTQEQITSGAIKPLTLPSTPLVPNTYSTLQANSHLEMSIVIKANVGSKIRVSFKTENVRWFKSKKHSTPSHWQTFSNLVEVTQKPPIILNPECESYYHDFANILSYTGDVQTSKKQASRDGISVMNLPQYKKADTHPDFKDEK